MALCNLFGNVSPYVCTDYFSSVYVAEWPPFWKELLTRLTVCSLYILTICNFSYFPFMVLMAGFGFRLLQFLVIAYL